MPMLEAQCPRCGEAAIRTGAQGEWLCPEHAGIVPLWRAERADYEGFATFMAMVGEFPCVVPWPLRPGWTVTDFAVVADTGGAGAGASATLMGVRGLTDDDGLVEMLAIVEDIGVGLGARCAGTPSPDPGPELGDGPPVARIKVETQQVPLWPVSTAEAPEEWDRAILDRSVLAGEWGGRWVWLVLRPAAAMLLFGEDWNFRDLTGMGPALVELPFGEHGFPW